MGRNSVAVCLMLLVAISTMYEVQGTFLLRHYLRKIPRRSRDAEPFACKGIQKFLNVLELRCPLKPRYRGFFGRLRTFMSFINTNSGSKNFDVDLKSQARGLQSSISAMSGGSSRDTSKVMNVLLSMGKTLGEQKRSDSTIMTFRQRRELIMSMVQWTRVISQFVVTCATKNGDSIDVKPLGLDDGVDDIDVGSSPSTPTTGSGTISSGTYKKRSDSTAGSINTETGTSLKASANYQQSNQMGSNKQTSTTESNVQD